jgi:hypothetical protein
MADQSSDRDPYQAEHLREALAQDPRVGELGVDVEIVGETVVLRGTLTSTERQTAATAIAHNLMPNYAVRNETAVPDCPEAPQVEHLP